MTETLCKDSTRNHLLSRLALDDFKALQRHLKPVDLPLRRELQVRNRAIEYAYFLESGFASVVVSGASRGIEIGLIGREGMTGAPLLMGVDRTPHDVFVQNAGRGWRIPATELQRAMAESRGLHDGLLLYAHSFSMQISYTAVANGRNKIEERLARWLLMARDRLDSDRLTITQEFLAQMLSVRRPGVTVALKTLEGNRRNRSRPEWHCHRRSESASETLQRRIRRARGGVATGNEPSLTKRSNLVSPFAWVWAGRRDGGLK